MFSGNLCDLIESKCDFSRACTATTLSLLDVIIYTHTHIYIYILWFREIHWTNKIRVKLFIQKVLFQYGKYLIEFKRSEGKQAKFCVKSEIKEDQHVLKAVVFTPIPEIFSIQRIE